MELFDCRGLPGRRRFAPEELACLAPVDDLRRTAPWWNAAPAERDGRDLPAVGLGCRRDPHIGHRLAVEPPPEQLADHQLLARPELELTHVDRSPAQTDAVGLDLGDAADADEHATALDGDDKAVHPGRPAVAGGVQDRIRHVANLGPVRSDEWQPHQTGDIHEATGHGRIVTGAPREIVANSPRLASGP